MSSTLGKQFVVTTFGESHGQAMGVVVDGIPAGLAISPDDIRFELQFRKTGNYLVSGRREADEPEIISGLFNGRTTGAPVAIIFRNVDAISSLYSEVSHKPRPGHSDLPLIRKYGRENWDYRGSGRASARETISRVAAGAIAKKLLMHVSTYVTGYLRSIGPVEGTHCSDPIRSLDSKRYQTRALDGETDGKFTALIKSAMKDGDSYGGVAEIFASNAPQGLGEPIFNKIKADIGGAILTIPAITGFEYGMGFDAARMKGSEAADEIVRGEGDVLRYRKNLSGGMLGGLTTGETIAVRCAFKPTSSIRIPAKTVDLDTLEPAEISVTGRHDPVVAVRGVSVAEAMMALVLVDHALISGLIPHAKLSHKEAGIIEERWGDYVKKCQ